MEKKRSRLLFGSRAENNDPESLEGEGLDEFASQLANEPGFDEVRGSVDGSTWMRFTSQYKLGALKFVNNDIEQSYQQSLRRNKYSLKTILTCAWAYQIITILWALKSILISGNEFLPGMLWVSQYLRFALVACIFVFLALFYIEKARPFILEYHNILSFWVVYLGGIVFICYVPMVITRTDLGWSSQAVHGMLMLVVQVNWQFRVFGILTQLIFYVVVSVISGYDKMLILAAVLYICRDLTVGLAGAYSMEMALRALYRQQQFCLYLIKQHAALSRKSAEQERNSNEAKSQFVANLSHEIRTPLHGVITALDLLKSTPVNKEQSNYIQVAETSSGLLLDILNNVLTLSKLQAGKVVLEKVPTDLREVIEGVTVVFSQMVSKKGVDIVSYVPPQLPPLLTDSVRLKQIFFNLVSNAVKFTASGHIRIFVDLSHETDSTVTLDFQISDTGSGIAPEKLCLLFQRFSQVDESNTRKFQGTGLGLALVFEFCRLLGGNISAHSQGLGHGTTFSFTATFHKDLQKISATHNHISTLTFQPNDLARPIAVLNGKDSSEVVPEWISLIWHSDSAVSEIWGKYLSHFGSQIAIDRDHAISALFAKSENLCRSLCLLLDERTCSTPSILGEIQNFLSRALEIHSSANAAQHISIFVLVMEEPVPSSGPSLRSTIQELSLKLGLENPKIDFHCIRKPCTLRAIQQTCESMREQLKEHLGSAFSKRDEETESQVSGGEEEGESGEQEREGSQSLVSTPHRRGGVVFVQKEPTSFFQSLSEFRFGPPQKEINPSVDEVAIDMPLNPNSYQGRHQSSDWSILSHDRLPESRLLSAFVTGDTAISQPQVQASGYQFSGLTCFGHSQPRRLSQVSVRLDRKRSVSLDLSSIHAFKRILIADDNAINRKLTERLLTKAGFECFTVENGALAVEAALQQHFSVIFMDVTMPIMDGPTAARTIRQRQKEEGVRLTPICGLSAAFGQTDGGSNEIAKDSFDFELPKPIKSSLLIETAERLVTLYHKNALSKN